MQKYTKKKNYYKMTTQKKEKKNIL